MNDEKMTISEVADALRVSDRTVRNWIEDGQLKAYKFGLQYRINKSDFEKFISESEVKPNHFKEEKEN